MLPLGTGRKLNVRKTFSRRPGHLLNVLCTFNLRLVPTGWAPFVKQAIKINANYMLIKEI